MEKGYVYLLMEDGKDDVYKIGVTKGTIENRIKKLQTGNSSAISICRYYQTDKPFFLEKKLHQRYQDRQVMNEWYELTSDEVFAFEQTCQNIENMLKSLKDNPFLPKELK